MLSHDLIDTIDDFNEVFSDDNYIVERLKGLSAAVVAMPRQIRSISIRRDGAQHIETEYDEMIRAVDEATDEFRGNTKATEFSRQIQIAIDSMDRLRQSTSYQLPEVVHYLRYFVDTYDAYMNSHSSSDSFDLAYAGHHVYLEIMSLRETLTAVRRALAPEAVSREGEDRLTLTFTDVTDYDTLLDRLAALREIYEVLCELANLSTEQYPLRIIKVETGSLHVDVAGCAAIIGAIGALLFKYANIPFQRFTAAGRAETFEKLMGVRDELHKRGIDTSQIDENLRDSGERLTESFSTLVQSNVDFTVNGESTTGTTPPPRLQIQEQTPPKLIEAEAEAPSNIECLDAEVEDDAEDQ